MSSSQAPLNYNMHDGSDFQRHPNDPRSNAPMHTDNLDLEQFIIDGNSHAQNPPLVHSTPPQLDVLGGHPQFSDFSFSYNGMPNNGMHGESNIENTLDPYALSVHGSVSGHQQSAMPVDHSRSISSMPGDHRASTASMPVVPQASFSNGPGQQPGNMSVSGGSDGASPSSNRAGGTLDGGYSDNFGLNNGGALDGSDLGTRSKEEMNDLNPPWSELKTKAGKERKRLPLACIACRRKKIRCSGEKPACKHCLRSRIPCVYKVTTRKAAPRTDYMAMLDKRLKRMEERIIKIVPKEEQDHTTVSIVRAIVKPAFPGTTPSRSSAGKKRPADEAFGPKLESWSKSIPNSNGEPSSRPSSLMVQEVEESKLSSEGAEALPSKEIQEHLSEVFFENLYGQTYHLLHRPSFMRKLKADTLPPVLVLAVCAISARFSTHPKLNTAPAFLRGEEWAFEAREIVMRRYEWPNITILTCMLILGLHEFGTCHGGRSWSLGGMAIRMAYALQLHRDLDYDPLKRNGTAELSFIDREIRRRTMWACFFMDRFNSSGTDRPTFIKEDSIKVQLPIKEKFFLLDLPGPTENLAGEVPHPISPGAGQLSDARENMGVAAYMVRSIALWGRIIQYQNLGGSESDPHPKWHPESGYAALIKQTEELEASLPDSIKYNLENLQTHQTEGLANQFLFLHVSVKQNILFMNRFAIPGQPGGRPPVDVPKEYVTKAGAKAFEAANRISELLRDGESHFITAPFTGYCAFMSSTVHVFGVFSKNPAIEETSKRNLATNVKYLSKMKRYWGMFHFMAENLKDQYRVCADAARRGPSAVGQNHQANIFQYGDWFDRYPYGVSQSDFEDPAGGIKKDKGDDAVLEQKSDYHTVEEFFSTLSPLPPQDAGKASKRKAKKYPPTRPDQVEPISTNIQNTASSQSMQIQQNNHQIHQGYNQMSQTTPVNMYHQQPQYYGHDGMAPLHHQGLLPQLDRQLVFGAYAGMDPSSLNSQSILGGTSWDMPLGGMSGFTEPSSAWFMPFNMEPPEINGEIDVFSNHSAGGGNSGYAIGGMQIHNNNGNMGGRGANN